MPISIPVIDMVEIGAGGGSLAHVDGMNQIRVGPQSAGSEPGPACYGRGGTHPAVTDADLVLGKLDPDNFAGGSIPLHPNDAKAALSAAIGTKLDMDATEAAWGLAEVVDENMANAARVHAVENGEDLSQYTMIAFGGAAPLHAARLCEKLGVGRCLVPQGAGVGSAIGFLRAPFSFEANRSVFMRLSNFDPDKVRALFAEMITEATRFVRSCDATAPIHSTHKLYMRYAGQGWEIPIQLTQAQATNPDAATFLKLFETGYEALFGRAVHGMDVEVTVWSVSAATQLVPAAPVAPASTQRLLSSDNKRHLFDPTSGAYVMADVITRDAFIDGAKICGPALITEDETTIVVPPSREVMALGNGTLDMRIKERAND